MSEVGTRYLPAARAGYPRRPIRRIVPSAKAGRVHGPQRMFAAFENVCVTSIIRSEHVLDYRETPKTAAVARRRADTTSKRPNTNYLHSWRKYMKTALAAIALALAAVPVLAQNVKITPIGSHPGELCANDRAIVFEDPT